MVSVKVGVDVVGHVVEGVGYGEGPVAVSGCEPGVDSRVGDTGEEDELGCARCADGVDGLLGGAVPLFEGEWRLESSPRLFGCTYRNGREIMGLVHQVVEYERVGLVSVCKTCPEVGHC